MGAHRGSPHRIVLASWAASTADMSDAAASPHRDVLRSDSPMSESLSVVIPCLNEADTIEACVRNALALLTSTGAHRSEVLVADNGSTDSSAELAQGAGARVVRVPARGYGAAIRGGIEAASHDIVVIGDADLSYDFLDARGMIAKMTRIDASEAGRGAPADVVIGNRFVGRIAPGAMAWHRRVGNRLLSGLGRRMFRVPIGDFHCGLRAVRREAFLTLDVQTDGMEFASEMIVRARVRGLRIGEHPVTLRRDGRTTHGSHLKPIQDGWRHVALLVSLSPRWAMFIPGLVMMGVGLILLAWVLPAPRRVFGVTIDVHTLAAGSLMTVLGFQAVVTGAIVRLHGLTARLMPPSARLTHVIRFFTLGKGLAMGGVLAMIGVVIAAWPALEWGLGGFGTLEPRITLRPLLAGATLAGLGGQTMLGAILLALLSGLKPRNTIPPAA